MKRNIFSQLKHPTILLIAAAIALYAFGAYAENIDPDSTGCKYAWAENVGWINFEPSWGPGVTVTDTAVTGMAWGENIGWIDLSPPYGGVVNDGTGKLSGYAWGENVGWINFNPASGGVSIESDGKFMGQAWGENIGWISFGSTGAFPFCLKTAWKLTITTFTITASAGANGSISPPGAVIVTSGADQTFTITANTGYHIADVLVDGSSVGAVGSYTFSNVTVNHTIFASFAINTFTVTPSAGANGSISPNTPQIVSFGSTTAFMVTPNANFHIASVTGCSGTLLGNTYTTGAISGNCTVTATFAIDTFSVTPSAGANGSISPNTAQIVSFGSTTEFTVTPNANFHIASVTGCGGTLSGNIYTTGAITADCAITAGFEINTYTISASAGENGTITPSGVVDYGDNKTFTITASTGYHIADVLVDGSSVGAIGSYTFANVMANHTISASFASTPTTYAFSGFFSPVDNLPTVNVAKAGQTIPVKWQMSDGNGLPIADPACFKSLTSYSVSCDSLSGGPTSEVDDYSAGSSGLQYLGDGYWQFNWKTPKTYAGQCGTMVLTLGDGTAHTASFKFNK